MKSFSLSTLIITTLLYNNNKLQNAEGNTATNFANQLKNLWPFSDKKRRIMLEQFKKAQFVLIELKSD